MTRSLTLALVAVVTCCATAQPFAANTVMAGLLENDRPSSGAEASAITAAPVCSPDVNFTRGTRYGDDAANIINVATAQTSPDARRPILVFIAGENFTGDSDISARNAFVEKAMCFAASNGLVAFDVSYRLAPAATWPSGTRDVAAAISWVFENADLFGGNGQEIIPIGYGAGAFHLASLLAHKEDQESDDLIAGAVLLSGMYEASKDTDADENEIAYFGHASDGSLERRSSFQGLTEIEEPIVLAWSSGDAPRLIAQGEQLEKKLCAAGHCPRTALIGKPGNLGSVFDLDGTSTGLHERLRQLISQLDARGLP